MGGGGRNEAWTQATAWMNPEDVTLSVISQTQHNPCDSTREACRPSGSERENVNGGAGRERSGPGTRASVAQDEKV